VSNTARHARQKTKRRNLTMSQHISVMTAIRRAMAARQEEQAAKKEWKKTPTVRAWLRHVFASAKKDRANEALSRAWCNHLGLDPDDVTDEALLSASVRLFEQAAS
jgi:hypothetical protein